MSLIANDTSTGNCMRECGRRQSILGMGPSISFARALQMHVKIGFQRQFWKMLNGDGAAEGMP